MKTLTKRLTDMPRAIRAEGERTRPHTTITKDAS
jgi:hypothetical protein